MNNDPKPLAAPVSQTICKCGHAADLHTKKLGTGCWVETCVCQSFERVEVAATVSKAEMHPIQIRSGYNHKQAKVTSLITAKAYDVYCAVYGPQPALMDLSGRNCRGGFGVGELIAFLYAHSFPKSEWKQRVDEAFAGMENVNG